MSQVTVTVLAEPGPAASHVDAVAAPAHPAAFYDSQDTLRDWETADVLPKGWTGIALRKTTLFYVGQDGAETSYTALLAKNMAAALLEVETRGLSTIEAESDRLEKLQALGFDSEADYEEHHRVMCASRRLAQKQFGDFRAYAKRPPRPLAPRAGEELVARVLSALDANASKPMIRLTGEGYVVAIQPRTNRPIAVVDGDFGRAEFKAVHAEAEAAGLALDAMIAVANTATYSGRGIHFSKFDELGLSREEILQA